MRTLFSLIACCLSVLAQPYKPNSLNTNALGTNLVWSPATFDLAIRGASPGIDFWNSSGAADKKRFTLTAGGDQLRFEWTSDNGGMSLLLGTFSSDGNFAPITLSLSSATNRLSIANNQLLMDGVALVQDSPTIIYTNVTVISNSFTVGKGGTLVITQALTLGFIKTNLLSVDANGLVTTTKFGANITWDPATQTINSTGGGGDTTGTNWVTLTQTGTNAAQLDFALVQNGGGFKLAATNNVYFGAPANVVAGIKREAWLFVQQPSTGTCYINFTNGFFAASEGAHPINDTNNGSVTVYQMVTDPFSNIVHLAMTAKSKLTTNNIP